MGCGEPSLILHALDRMVNDKPLSRMQFVKPAFGPQNIAAVFCTMNRWETALVCVERLSHQTTRPGKLIIADNCSQDDTFLRLEELRTTVNLPFEVLQLPENVGNAGGVQAAMDEAFAQGFDAVWILDDDSWPDPTALEMLLEPAAPEGIRTSAVFELENDRLSWPCEIMTDRQKWQFATDVLPAVEGEVIRVKRSWLGALIPRPAYDKVGPVNDSLFLRGEDEEYPRRLANAGYHFWMMPRSILRHPSAGAIDTLRFGPYKLSLERNLSGDKLFYRVRNMLWIKRKESGIIASSFLFAGYLCIVARSKNRSGPIFKVLWQAWGAANADHLGKRGAR